MNHSREESGESSLLLMLPPGLLVGRVWPEELVIVGVRVCRTLREELMQHATRVVLAAKPASFFSSRCDMEQTWFRWCRVITRLNLSSGWCAGAYGAGWQVSFSEQQFDLPQM